METQDQLEAVLRAQKEAEAIARLEAHLREKQQAERSMKRRLRANSFFGFVAGVVVTSLVASTVDIPMLLRNSNSITGLGIVRASATPTVLLATSTPWPTPMPMSTEEPVRIAQVQVESNMVCIVTEEGGVKCKQAAYKSTWKQIKNLERGVKSVAFGGSAACAVLHAGSVKCWTWSGFSTYDQNYNYTAYEVIGSDAGVSAMALRHDAACVLTNQGGVKCWSWPQGSDLSDVSMEEVDGVRTGVKMIAAGNEHVCALLNSGGVKCWGKNDNGQLGDGWTRSSSAAREVVGLGRGVKTIAAGGDHTCAVLNSGSAKCWGQGSLGQLGNGAILDVSVPQEVIGLSGKVTAMAMGFSHTCAVMDNGDVKCWGSNSWRQMGEMPSDAPDTIRMPLKAMSFDGGVIAITAGDQYTCVLLIRGSVVCKGTHGGG